MPDLTESKPVAPPQPDQSQMPIVVDPRLLKKLEEFIRRSKPLYQKSLSDNEIARGLAEFHGLVTLFQFVLDVDYESRFSGNVPTKPAKARAIDLI